MLSGERRRTVAYGASGAGTRARTRQSTRGGEAIPTKDGTKSKAKRMKTRPKKERAGAMEVSEELQKMVDTSERPAEPKGMPRIEFTGFGGGWGEG